MKTTTLIIGLIAVSLSTAIGYGLYDLGMRNGMQMTGSATTNGGAEKKAVVAPETRKPMYWHDPMVPQQKFDHPGKSPFMDMQLVPVYADSNANEGAVKISSRVQQNLGVRTAKVTKGVLGSTVTAVGSVAYNERDVVVVQARSNGFVEQLYVRAPFDPVRQGQALAALYAPEWVAVQEEYLSAKGIAAASLTPDLKDLVDGARQRMRLAGMDDAQIELVEQTSTVHAPLTITAPRSGVITELGAREGMTVMAGASLFRINGLATVWVNAALREMDARYLNPGSTVEAHAAAFPGETFKGKVGALLPEVDLTTRTLKARIEIANPDERLKPGMFVTVKFAPPIMNEVVLVPTEAVIQTGTRAVVMVAEDGGKFAPVEVEVGSEGNGQTEILKGLEANQQVVVSGQFLIDSEASLKGTVARMGSEKGMSSAAAASPLMAPMSAPAMKGGMTMPKEMTR